MIDMPIILDYHGQGETQTTIGRICIANRGPSDYAKRGWTKYEVWLFIEGNTDCIPGLFTASADANFFVVHRRKAGIWKLLRQVYTSPEFKEFADAQKTAHG